MLDYGNQRISYDPKSLLHTNSKQVLSMYWAYLNQPKKLLVFQCTVDFTLFTINARHKANKAAAHSWSKTETNRGCRWNGSRNASEKKT